MKPIANILTDKSFINDGIYNVVNNPDNLISGIPTLIIGWEYTKTFYPDANILNWEINSDTYWCFGKRERGQRYEETIIKFRNYAINRLIKSIKYKFINIIVKNDFYSSLLDILNLCDDMNAYVTNDMLYLACSSGDVVYGISLRDIEYLGYNKKTIFSTLHNNKNLKFVDYNELNWDIKNALRNCIYAVPCLY